MRTSRRTTLQTWFGRTCLIGASLPQAPSGQIAANTFGSTRRSQSTSEGSRSPDLQTRNARIDAENARTAAVFRPTCEVALGVSLRCLSRPVCDDDHIVGNAARRCLLQLPQSAFVQSLHQRFTFPEARRARRNIPPWCRATGESISYRAATRERRARIICGNFA